MRSSASIFLLVSLSMLVEGFAPPSFGCQATLGLIQHRCWKKELGEIENAQGMLEEAFGAGKGKHAGKERRRHTNKYKSDSKASDLDPWEMQLRQSKEAEAKKNREEEIDIEMVKERKERRKQERGEIVFPSEEEIDPYDPSTFGFIEVGKILGAHGVKGEVKLRSVSDFGVHRLCTAGPKHIKAPNRRYPREIELLEGRLQKEDIYLVHFEGITTREAAAALRGFSLYVLEEERPKLEAGEYMVRDLVGASAFDINDPSVYLGEVVGAVLGDDISSTRGLAGDLLELRLPLENLGDNPRVCYVPFVPQIVPIVDISEDNQCVILDLPEGLLETAWEIEEKVVIRGMLPEKSGQC